MKAISLLGSTGSIGTQSLDVIRQHPKEFRIVGLACNNKLEIIEGQINEFRPEVVSVADNETAEKLKEKISGKTEVVFGERGLETAATIESADTVVGALVGFLGLKPTIQAIRAGKNIALANKETLVAGGSIVMKEVRDKGVVLTPIDSEHCALFQCLNGEKIGQVAKLIITCSGGPFKFKKTEELRNVTVEQALGHPTWKMGKKITIDSSTLMNKGLEIIEAHWLYGMPYEKIEAIMHPQSIVHSMVEFVDGSVIGQIGTHDMRTPIQYALSYPDRIPNDFPKMDFIKTQKLEFFPLDEETFECLAYAKEAGNIGGTMPTAMNAANEEAVYAFLDKKIGFLDIARVVRKSMDCHKTVSRLSLEEIIEADRKAREGARKEIAGMRK
ncbi:MAG: 1-deoxy-D-xylulose-5-phosphate reductoisomerase [archaeon]